MDAEMNPENESAFLGEYPTLRRLSTYTIDGRYLFSSSDHELQIIDTFHSKIRCFEFKLSPNLMVDGQPQNLTKKPLVRTFYPLSLDTVVLYIQFYNGPLRFLGVGCINYEDSLVLIEDVVTIGFTVYSWLPTTFPPNLKDGMFCRALRTNPVRYVYILLRFGVDNQLQQTRIMDEPHGTKTFGCMNGFVYGLLDRRAEDRWPASTEPIGVDLVKINLSTKEHIQQQTSNWDEMKAIVPHVDVVPVGLFFTRNRVLKCYRNYLENKIFSISLDLNSLEWRKGFKVNGRISSIAGDGAQTLIVRLQANSKNQQVYKFYRFVLEPEKLSTLVWLQLRKIFDARSETAYRYILSKVPAKFQYTPL